MASGTFYPAVGADDGYGALPSGGYDNSSNVILLGNAGGISYSIWMRFPSVTIPQGSTIMEAYVKFTCAVSGSNTVCNLNCYFNAGDNPSAPGDIATFNGLALTGAVAWNALPAWTDGSQYDTPSLVSILQNIVDRAGFSSGNAVQLVVKDNSSDSNAKRETSSIELFSGTEKAELHVTWVGPLEVETTDGAGMSDVYEAIVLAGSITDGAGMSDSYEVDTPHRDIIEGCGVDDVLARSFETLASITDGAGMVDVTAGIFEIFTEITDGVGITDAYTRYIEASRSITDGTGTADDLEVIRIFNKTVVEALSAWITLKWGWNKTIADSLAIADTASKILGIPVKEWLTLTDTETNNWNGVESISDSFYAVDIAKAVKVFNDLLADGMAVTDAVKISLELIITDILTCTDAIINTGTFQHSIEDGMTLEDVAKRFFPKSVSDSFAATDTSLVDFLALLQISDSFNAADTASKLLTINQTIADSLEALDTVTVQQLIYELIQEGLNFDVSVIIDGEVWECWVLNTSRFHPSVYSNYEFNSFAIDRSNNICYGCKSDGIYTLEGSTDNGTPIRAGIILPKTDFGLMNNKRMRKAWLAVDDDNLILKLETESGDKTFKMTDAECSLTRDLKGRRWEISVEGFESMDSLNLVPVILSRK